MREVMWMVRVLLAGSRLFIWVSATVLLGASALFRLAIVACRWRRVFGGDLHCARGHVTPAYGVYECCCGALVEDWVFARCRVCRQSAGWTPCAACGLPLKNPLLV